MRFYLLFLLCSSPFSLFAQQSTIRKAQNSYEQAQPYFKKNQLDEGVKYLEMAIQADPNFKIAYMQLGDAYKKLKNSEKAKETYLKATQFLGNADVRIYYLLGESELYTGAYTEAKLTLNKFLAGYKGTDTTAIKKAKKYLTDCDFAVEAIKNPVKYQPVNMGNMINSENRDYFPTLTADLQTIIFSRVINENEDFFTASKKGGEWDTAQPLSQNINTINFNEGAQSISPDGKYLFFTGCNRPDGLGRCDIFVSRKEGNTWGKASNLGPVINSKDWESQPSISPDGTTLYFASNRSGGFGGNDIWKSNMDENGKWGKPINLGPQINTLFDETTPFIHADNNTLYFASDGWPGMGNKDIFYSRILKDGSFAKPINLGYPVNTFNEEVGLMVTADGSKGLFSSNLKGGFGDIDIYQFEMGQKAKPLPVTYIKGIVKDSETKKPLEASIMVIDLEKNKAVYNDYTSSETGDFLTVTPIGHQYAFNAQADGYLFYSKHYKLQDNNTNKPFEVEILLQKIEVGNKVTLNNIFFDTNKAELKPSSKIELEILIDLLKTNPTLKIEIQGHTDNVGDLKANQILSENRAKSVYNYLISNGISIDKLSFKGYGENQPTADNASENGRQKNRRTDFMVVGV